jgi:DnaJ family protein C protein 7
MHVHAFACMCVQAQATAMMKDVNEAFSVLSDPKKRRRYDAGEDDLDGPEHGHSHGGMDPDMFANMFFRAGGGGGSGGAPFGRR